MKILAVILAVMMSVAMASRDKGYSTMPMYYPQMNYHQKLNYDSVSYAPVYHAKAYDSYAYDLPQYSFKNDYKAYIPVVKYVAVKSVPYYGPSKAFYPENYGGGGYY